MGDKGLTTENLGEFRDTQSQKIQDQKAKESTTSNVVIGGKEAVYDYTTGQILSNKGVK